MNFYEPWTTLQGTPVEEPSTPPPPTTTPPPPSTPPPPPSTPPPPPSTPPPPPPPPPTSIRNPENGRHTHSEFAVPADHIDHEAQQKEFHIKKLELKVSGFIDLSGLIATFAVLVLLLSQPNRNEYFLPVMVFIFLSMILQCILAVILVIRHNTLDAEAHIIGGFGDACSEERNWYIRESRRLLTVSSLALIFITIFNILIAAFVGLAGASSLIPQHCPRLSGN